MPNVTAFGFIDLEYIFQQRVTPTAVPTIQEAIRLSYEEHNRQVMALMSELVERTTNYKFRYQLAGAKELQPLDAKGIPRPTVPSGTYDIAFPIKGGGDAWGDDRVARGYLTVEDTNRFTMDAMTADLRWLRRHMLAAVFTNISYVYSDKKYGDLTVMPMANGDTVTYVRVNGDSSTDNHFLAQAAAIDNSNNPYPLIYNELNEHPGNAGPYVAYIPTNLVGATQALTNFIEVQDADIAYGADLTVTNATINTDLVGQNSPLVGFGNRLLGKIDGVWVVEWQSLPDSYIIGVARGGENPLGMREHEVTELQGLFPEFFSPDGNFMENRYIRYAGFGARNRLGALVYRIGNASYAIPAGFNASLLG